MPRIEKEVLVKSSQGLHARPAALFVQMAIKYDSSLMIKKDGETVNGKQIMGILMLGVQRNAPIVLIADGEDAAALVAELEAFLSKDE